MLLACEPAGLWAVPLVVHCSDGQTSRFSGEPSCYATSQILASSRLRPDS